MKINDSAVWRGMARIREGLLVTGNARLQKLSYECQGIELTSTWAYHAVDEKTTPYMELCGRPMDDVGED